jgi:hypothetical protein
MKALTIHVPAWRNGRRNGLKILLCDSIKSVKSLENKGFLRKSEVELKEIQEIVNNLSVPKSSHWSGHGKKH